MLENYEVFYHTNETEEIAVRAAVAEAREPFIRELAEYRGIFYI